MRFTTTIFVLFLPFFLFAENIDFAVIPSGTFIMGSPLSEVGRFENEVPHQVTITKDFELQVTEVTQSQWLEIMGYNDSFYSRKEYCDDYIYLKGYGLCPTLPVESVSWNEVQDFIEKLNNSQTTYQYRLPTEAEWEYAARAGSTTAYCFGDDISILEEYAGPYGSRIPHKVGTRKINQFGLFDVHGNVSEMVLDSWGKYSVLPEVDPIKNSNSPYGARVIRGGDSYQWAYHLRSAFRFYIWQYARYSSVGFRLLRVKRSLEAPLGI